MHQQDHENNGVQQTPGIIITTIPAVNTRETKHDNEQPHICQSSVHSIVFPPHIIATIILGFVKPHISQSPVQCIIFLPQIIIIIILRFHPTPHASACCWICTLSIFLIFKSHIVHIIISVVHQIPYFRVSQ